MKKIFFFLHNYSNINYIKAYMNLYKGLGFLGFSLVYKWM